MSIIKQNVEEIIKKLAELDNERKLYQDALTALRNICTHDMKNRGHGHNYTLYRCTICGLEEHN